MMEEGQKSSSPYLSFARLNKTLSTKLTVAVLSPCLHRFSGRLLEEMKATPHALYQSAELLFNFDKHSLRGRSTLWLLWENERLVGSNFHLNFRQCIVDNVTVNGYPCSFVHNDPLKMVVDTKSSGETQPSYCGEEMDINYRAALEITRHGELQIQLPKKMSSSRQQLPPLPSRVQKEVFSRFENLTKFQQELLESVGSTENSRILLVVTVDYHLKAPLRSWGGWSMLVNTTSPNPAVTQCWTRHGDESLFSADGVRTWLPCVDDPSRQTVFDISITVPKYCRSSGNRNPSDRYRVLSSGLLVSSGPAGSHSNLFTYRYITPNCIPVHSLGIYIGLVKETFNTPLYLGQGQVWVGEDNNSSGCYSRFDHSPALDQRAPQLPQEQMEGSSHLSEQVTHTLLGLDAAIRHVHKVTQRAFTYRKCAIVFLPELDADFLSFDGFFLLNSTWLHTDSFIYLETSAHLLLLQAYLSSWFKGSLFLDSYSAEFLHFGSIGFLLNEYVEHIFGPEDARYRFLKQYNAVINFEKASCSAALAIPFPDDYFRLGEFFLKYLPTKAAVLFHIVCHRAGGHTETILRAIKNMIKTEELMKTSRSGGQMPPPELPGALGMTVPLMPGTWVTSPVTPMMSPPYSPPSTPTYFGPLSPLVHFERKRSDSITSTGESNEIPDELSLPWKMDPNDPAEAASAAIYQSKKSSSVNASEFFFPPPPPLAQQTSTSSMVEISTNLEKAIWGPDSRGGNSSMLGFLADVKEISGGVSGDLNESFIEQFVTNPGCMFLRAGVSVNSKHKRADIALHQVGFRSGVVDSARFIYKDKVPIHVVEAEVWQYSRRVDGKAQIVSFNLHSKPRRQGGRNKRLTPEELAIGGSQGPTMETLSLSEEVLASGRSGPSDASSREINLTEATKYLCPPEDIAGGRVQAQALAAIRAGSVNGTSSAGNASQSVQFIGIDPEVHWIREVHLNSPDDLLIEQLYADMDIIGQITALRTLAQSHISHQTIPTQILRLRALKDVLLNGTNDGNVVHSLAVRMEAIYALAEWQNAHAPMNPRPRRGDHSAGYSWAGLDILLGCLRGMFTDLCKTSAIPSLGTDPDSADSSKPTYLPIPNDFTDHTKTQIRSALLISLSSIRSGNGETPPDVIEELLHFAENNDNNASAAASTETQKDSSGDDPSQGPTSFDDGHYCSVLLFCLSKVACNPSSPLSVQLLKRIVEVSKYYLHRESILTAAQFYEEEGNAGAGISRARGYYMFEEGFRHKKAASKSAVGRGFVTALALQCICRAEIQLDAAHYEPFNFRQYITAPPAVVPGAGAESSKAKATDQEQSFPVVPAVSGLVRASALDCLIRIAFAKHIARLLLTGATEDQRRPTAPDSASKKAPSPADAINLTLSVIVHDPSRQVRRDAALSLLYALQDRPSFLSYRVLSLSDPSLTYNWSDPSGLVVLGNEQSHQRKYSSEHRQAITKSTTNSTRSCLKKLWNFIASNPIAVFDQTIRCSLFFSWLYVFQSRKTGKQQVPRSLLASSSLSTPATPATGETAGDENQTANAVLPPSYQDRFPLLPYLGPLCIRDPIESSADLEEAMRVGNYGRQIIKADTQTRGADSGAGAGANGSVLKLSRKMGGSEDQLAGAKRGHDSAAATASAAVKRPKLVKFIMS